MKLHFENLDYQARAAQSVVGVFAGCEFAVNANAPALGNPVCDYAQTAERIRAVREMNNIESHGEVDPQRGGRPLNLDVVMETGTGKTFTFIDTVYRLNREYGLSKFVILVPSNAIRAGAMKNLEITRPFFARYGAALSAHNYSESAAAAFVGASNKKISVLVATFASFNKVGNIIHKKKLERGLLDGSRSYMEAIGKIRPVIIIDEPHRAGGEKTKKHLPQFNAQIVLRYGATFKKDDLRNLVYAMDSASAFREGLVKSITVSSVSLTADDSLKYKGRTGICGNYSAEIVYSSRADGCASENSCAAREGDNLGEKLGAGALNGYVVEKITKSEIRFDNGYALPFGAEDSCSELKGEARKAILQAAIRRHLQKEPALFDAGMKALSLFFIDSVGAYLTDSNAAGELAQTFDALYDKERAAVLSRGGLSADYRKYLESSRGAEVRGGYFAKSNKAKDNEEEIDLILRNKEKLLRFSEPRRFIFSKWALREGWDNPNIFTLAKLAPSNSEITKLQQIGRGLRLPVNQDGRRLTAESVLDVIVPGSEEDFVRGIQENIDDASLSAGARGFSNRRLIDCGICPSQKSANRLIEGLTELGLITSDDDYNAVVVSGPDEFARAKAEIIALAKTAGAGAEKLLRFMAEIYEVKSKIKSAAQSREQAKINKANFAKFKDAWARINSEAVIKYEINTPELIKQAAAAINKNLNVASVRIRIDRSAMAESVKNMIVHETEYQGAGALGGVATFGEFMGELAGMTKLTRRTLAKILRKMDGGKFESIKINPKQAAREIARICTETAHGMVMQKIGYDIIETRIKSTSLTDGEGGPREAIDAGLLGRHLLQISEIENDAARGKSLYENVTGYDSGIEKKTIEESGVNAVTVYAKLPRVGIKTPIGEYSPDFAFVVCGGESSRLYLVVETKGYDDFDRDAREREKKKMECARKFFEAVDARFPGARIVFRKKLNDETMANIISEIRGGD